jgi:hypothetical protein
MSSSNNKKKTGASSNPIKRSARLNSPAADSEKLFDNSISAHDIMASVLCKLGPNRFCKSLHSLAVFDYIVFNSHHRNRSVEALHHINRVLWLTENNQTKYSLTREKMARFRDGLEASQRQNAKTVTSSTSTSR